MKMMNMYEEQRKILTNGWLVKLTSTEDPICVWYAGQGSMNVHKGIEGMEQYVWGEPLKKVIPYKRFINAVKKREKIEEWNRFFDLDWAWECEVEGCHIEE